MTFYDISTEFLCSYPLLFTAGMCDVMYIRVYNTYLHTQMFSVRALQRYNLPHINTVNASLCV